MYTKDKSDSIFELSPIVVKFADVLMIVSRDAKNIN